MGGRLEGAETAGYAFSKHHPILDVCVGRLGSRGELNHGIRFVGQSQAKRVDRNSVSPVSMFCITASTTLPRCRYPLE